MEKLYKKWIQYLFNRPETEWYWDFGLKAFEASNEELARLVSRLFENAGADLKEFSDTQVAYGLNYIFNNAISNTIFSICQKGDDEDLRINAVLNMKHLYKNCLAKRCENKLSHDQKVEVSPLNTFCYMLWDTSPLCQWKDVVLDVMEDALYIPNDACIESALHGLGHRYSQDEIKVPDIIDRFLSKAKNLNPDLRIYAQSAKTGCIQ